MDFDFYCEICGASISMFTGVHLAWHIRNGEEEEVKKVLLEREAANEKGHQDAQR